MNLRKSPSRIVFLSVMMIACADDVAAQSSGNTSMLLYSLIVLVAILLIGAIIQVADNLLRIEARRRHIPSEGLNLWGGFGPLLTPKLPTTLSGQDVHLLKAGYDIKLEGEAAHVILDGTQVTRFALRPQNFTDMSPIPKVLVEVGDNVKAGQPLFFDKKRPEVLYAAPVSGEILAIDRGAKRAISEIVILADKQIQYIVHKVPDVEQASRESLVQFLLETGAWPLIQQRPYNVVPDPHSVPVNIFITTFDSAPLAPDSNFVIQGKGEEFQKGLDILAKLTSGKVHLGLDGRGDATPSAIFTQATGVKKHWFRGPHPAGNVGVQIHHVAPLKPGQKIWTLGIQEVAAIGQLFISGILDGHRILSISGSPVTKPGYMHTYLGAQIGELLKDNLQGDNLRFISGDVLSGEQKSPDGFMNYHDDQVTVMKEGNQYEMFGWLLPLTERPSVSRTFPNFMFPNSTFIANSSTHGEKRAFVMTGQYEEMLPMKIYPQHLMKAILANDLEKMEGLGIFELSGEDIALCEFACTSKMPLQQILKDGQKVMREQG